MAISVRFDLYKTMYSIAIIDTCCHEQSLYCIYISLSHSLFRCTFIFCLVFEFLLTLLKHDAGKAFRITQMYKYVARNMAYKRGQIMRMLLDANEIHNIDALCYSIYRDMFIHIDIYVFSIRLFVSCTSPESLRVIFIRKFLFAKIE